jgi:hypothetical protein
MPCCAMLHHAVLHHNILCYATPHLDVGLLVGTAVGLALGLALGFTVGFLLDGLIVDGLNEGFALGTLTVGLEVLKNKKKSQFTNKINLKKRERACRGLNQEVNWLC